MITGVRVLVHGREGIAEGAPWTRKPRILATLTEMLVPTPDATIAVKDREEKIVWFSSASSQISSKLRLCYFTEGGSFWWCCKTQKLLAEFCFDLDMAREMMAGKKIQIRHNFPAKLFSSRAEK